MNDNYHWVEIYNRWTNGLTVTEGECQYCLDKIKQSLTRSVL